MRKIVLLLIAIISLSSCDNYCPYCDGYGNCDYCGSRVGIAYKDGDYFSSEKLLGTWQCDYNNYVGNMLLKEIEFFDGNKCDIVYSIGREVDWYTDTFTYSYVSGYIKFARNGTAFSFKVKGYLFPELYVQDSFGTYSWRKVKAYGC